MKYKAAIIGLGDIAYKIDTDLSRKTIWTHAKGFKTHKNIDLIAVSDIKESHYRDFNIYYKNINYYKSYLEMLKNNKLDIISICTPTNTHLKIIKEIVCLKSFKAIFFEKPMGLDLKEAEEISALCVNSGIVLAVNYMRRWENKYIYLKTIIDNKELGHLHSITAYGSTALLTSTSHLIDLFLYYGGDFRWLVGSLQTEYVRKVHGYYDPGGYAFTRFSNGVFGFLKGVSKDPLHYMFEIDLLFSDARATLSSDGESFNLEKFTNSNSTSGAGYKVLEKVDLNQSEFKKNERMLDAISDILDCINTKKLPKSNGLNAIKVHKFIQAIKDSNSQDNNKINYND